MLYYDESSERLFFTTTLQHAVQSYSLEERALLDPGSSHPSPPTAFAVSPQHDILLSASANPPTVYLSKISEGRLPLLLQPMCTLSPVVASAFHPEHGNIFALGFADGTLATYDLKRFVDENGALKPSANPGYDGEIAHIKTIHLPGTESSSSPTSIVSPFPDYDYTTRTLGIGEHISSINSVAFVPGSDCTTVSVASDGKCCVVDFEGSVSHRMATIFRSWHVRAAATTIAIVQSKPKLEPSPSQFDGSFRDYERRNSLNDIIVAVGREDGQVMIYNLDGDLIARRDFGKDLRIVDLGWLESPQNPDSPNLGHSDSAISNGAQRIPSGSEQALDSPTKTVKNTPSRKGTKHRPPVIPPRMSPRIPARPVPRNGGKLATRRAEIEAAKRRASGGRKASASRKPNNASRDEDYKAESDWPPTKAENLQAEGSRAVENADKIQHQSNSPLKYDQSSSPSLLPPSTLNSDLASMDPADTTEPYTPSSTASGPRRPRHISAARQSTRKASSKDSHSTPSSQPAPIPPRSTSMVPKPLVVRKSSRTPSTGASTGTIIDWQTSSSPQSSNSRPIRKATLPSAGPKKPAIPPLIAKQSAKKPPALDPAPGLLKSDISGLPPSEPDLPPTAVPSPPRAPTISPSDPRPGYRQSVAPWEHEPIPQMDLNDIPPFYAPQLRKAFQNGQAQLPMSVPKPRPTTPPSAPTRSLPNAPNTAPPPQIRSQTLRDALRDALRDQNLGGSPSTQLDRLHRELSRLSTGIEALTRDKAWALVQLENENRRLREELARQRGGDRERKYGCC